MARVRSQLDRATTCGIGRKSCRSYGRVLGGHVDSGSRPSGLMTPETAERFTEFRAARRALPWTRSHSGLGDWPRSLSAGNMRTLVAWLMLAAFSLVSAVNASAQSDFAQHERSAAPPESRYQLVQSTLVARSTFRLDKMLGQIDQIVMRDDSSITWQRVPRREHPSGDPQVTGRVNYQLFLSGLANRHTYLMNVNNGSTWQLVLTKEETLVWEPVQ
jgi:hypothetical protein